MNIILIGIYKLGLQNVKSNKNGALTELFALHKLFMKNRHECMILNGYVEFGYRDKYDIIYVLNGLDESPSHTTEKLIILRGMCDKLNFIMTDLRLRPHRMYNHSNYYDNIYTQTIEKIIPEWPPEHYNGMPELALYSTNIVRTIKNKDIDFVFGGGVRNRQDDFDMYIRAVQCDHEISSMMMIKDEEAKSDTRVPVDEYYRILERSKFSVVIADKEYNEFGFITWRFFENLSKGIISFIDSDFDKHRLIKNEKFDFLIVNNYKELKSKMESLNDEQHQKLLDELLNHYASEEATSGRKTYECLMKGNDNYGAKD